MRWSPGARVAFSKNSKIHLVAQIRSFLYDLEIATSREEMLLSYASWTPFQAITPRGIVMTVELRAAPLPNSRLRVHIRMP